VGFKSKVVSRKHCEFSFVDGQWQIRDVASSSGTFLNHIRLSQPNTESKLFPVKDGDIVQLGIDFRGGEEMIFRCVKIRIECNRAWQKKPNNFKSVRPVSDQNRADKYYSKSRHQQLQSLAKDQPSADANSGECSICLGSVLVSGFDFRARMVLIHPPALSSTIRCSLRACLALQMHSSNAGRQKQHLSAIPVSELPSLFRFGGGRGCCPIRHGRMDGQHR
jgi:hypothetical protein